MMKLKQSKHIIGIRDYNDNDLDVEEFIKSIEAQYKFDFRTLPHWKELLQLLHVTSTDCKRRIQDANLRKSLIIRKLFIEYTRPTPFELTNCFARTGKKWETLKDKNKRKRDSYLKLPGKNVNGDSSGDISGEFEEITETPHQNTQVEQSHSRDTFIEPLSSINNYESHTNDIETNLFLPPYISTNPHKRLSSYGSEDDCLHTKNSYIDFKHDNEPNYEWMKLKPNKSVACSPKEIILKNDVLTRQTLKFTLTNCSREFVHVRFKNVTETFPFKGTKILPETPIILYPGIPAVFKFVFKLKERKQEFTSELFFKISRNVYAQAPAESLRIPIVTKFIKARSVSITKAVYLSPVYSWHMGYPNYPSGTVKISVNDDHFYHLHVVKRIDTCTLAKRSDTSLSNSDIDINASTVVHEIENKDVMKSSTLVREINKKQSTTEGNHIKDKYRKEEDIKQVKEDIQTSIIGDMSTILKNIVEDSLDTFVLEQTYLFLKPGSKHTIAVYLCKAEHIGCHNCYYDFLLINPETDEVVLTETTRIFAEVLPHPIQVQPVILDMSSSHVIYGFCEDQFKLINTHKIIPVTIKFRLSKTMKKLFRILPMETVIPAQGSVVFDVRFCSRDRDAESDDLVHFSIQIIVIGHNSVYRDAPPIIYEIIAPCVHEYSKICHDKYYRDLMTETAMKLV